MAFQDSGSSATSRAQVAVTHGYITSRLGVAFEPSAIRQSLETLGFSVELDGDVFRVTAPTWRSTGDVSLPADIVEEVARRLKRRAEIRCLDTAHFLPCRLTQC